MIGDAARVRVSCPLARCLFCASGHKPTWPRPCVSCEPSSGSCVLGTRRGCALSPQPWVSQPSGSSCQGGSRVPRPGCVFPGSPGRPHDGPVAPPQGTWSARRRQKACDVTWKLLGGLWGLHTAGPGARVSHVHESAEHRCRTRPRGHDGSRRERDPSVIHLNVTRSRVWSKPSGQAPLPWLLLRQPRSRRPRPSVEALPRRPLAKSPSRPEPASPSPGAPAAAMPR